TGITTVLLAVPALGSVLIAASIVYILWLAYHVATAPPLSTAPATRPPSLWGGAILGVANPKAWVAIAAVFASARLSHRAAVDGTFKVALLGAMIVVINGAWLIAGRSLAPLLRHPRRARAVNVALALVLVGAS